MKKTQTYNKIYIEASIFVKLLYLQKLKFQSCQRALFIDILNKATITGSIYIKEHKNFVENITQKFFFPKTSFCQTFYTSNPLAISKQLSRLFKIMYHYLKWHMNIVMDNYITTFSHLICIMLQFEILSAVEENKSPAADQSVSPQQPI